MNFPHVVVVTTCEVKRERPHSTTEITQQLRDSFGPYKIDATGIMRAAPRYNRLKYGNKNKKSTWTKKNTVRNVTPTVCVYETREFDSIPVFQDIEARRVRHTDTIDRHYQHLDRGIRG